MERLPMTIKASGRSALIIATGLFVCLAGPSQAVTDAAADSKTERASGTKVALHKHVRHGSRHWKRYAHHKSARVALKSDDGRKTASADEGDKSSVIPQSVANANAQMTSADTPAASARAMSARANDILQAAPANPADAQPASYAEVVAADQLNDVDRALHESPRPAATQAMASADAPVAPVAPAMASSNESSTWDQTSLIGKIFIGFGALLTMASAARMFMA
jgi:hypothetical protein